MGVKLLLGIIALGGGLTVGGAAAAFITILQIIPRLVQITDTKNYKKIYEWVMIVSFILFVLVYFFDYNIKMPKFLVSIIGLLYGMFIGLLSSALAEVLNVIPVLSKKLKIKDNLKYTIWALMMGKVVGTLYYWLFII